MPGFIINGKRATAGDWKTLVDYIRAAGINAQRELRDNKLTKKEALRLFDKNRDNYIHWFHDKIYERINFKLASRFVSVFKKYKLHYIFENEGIDQRFRKRGRADERGRFLATLSSQDQIVVLGEYHRDLEPKRFFVSNMRRLKTLGFTHIGLEYFTTDKQALLDRYIRTGSGLDEIKTYLKNKWPSLPHGEVIAFIKAARTNGMKLVAMDNRVREKNSAKLNVVQQDVIWRTRNKTMARSIQLLADRRRRAGQRFKIICLVGDRHAAGQITHYMPHLKSKQFSFGEGAKTLAFGAGGRPGNSHSQPKPNIKPIHEGKL